MKIDFPHTYNDLVGMTLKRLEEVADEAKRQHGLTLRTWNKSHNKGTRARDLLAAIHDKEVDAMAAGGSPTSPGEPKRPANPAFEALCDVVPAAPGSAPVKSDVVAVTQPEPVDGRGGDHGGGRPQGATAERTAVRKLSEVPHPTIQDGLEFLFVVWSEKVGCEAVALTKDEAFDIGLRWTRILELVGVAQRIPEWASVVIEGLWDTYNLLKLKAQAARQAVADRPTKPATGPAQQVEVTRAIVVPVAS